MISYSSGKETSCSNDRNVKGETDP